MNLPSDIENLTLDNIEFIVSNSLMKNQLVIIGTIRFGISKSKLEGLNKHRIIESIKAAVEHERSINIIGDVAKQTGINRKS